MKKFKNVLLLMLLAVTIASCSRVESGYVGVKVNLLGGNKGVDNEVLGVGRYWIGMNEQLFVFPTYQINYTYTKDVTEGDPLNEEFTFQTKEGMLCQIDLGVAMHFNPDKIAKMFQTYHKGETEIRSVVVRNTIRDGLNKIAGSMPVEYVYGEGKGKLIDSLTVMTRSKLCGTGIEIDNVYLIGAIRIPDAVRTALNSKVEATQLAQKAENEVRRAEANAKIQEATAQGNANSVLINAKAQADANRLLNASITDNLVRYKALEVWDGKSPTYWGGGALPFLNIK